MADAKHEAAGSVGRGADPVCRPGWSLAGAYDAHAGWMFRHALLLLADHAAAEDAVQQVFVKVARMGAQAEQIESPAAYLRQALRRECYRLIGSRRHGPASAKPLLEPVAPQAPDDGMRQEIESALRRLPVDQREVVYLKVYEGMTFQQIAAALEVPANTAASRYRYAMQKLREYLGPG